MGPIQQKIQAKLEQELNPANLEVLNESHMHRVPPGSESHFKVIIVSDQFEELPRVRRHQQIYALLKEEIDAGVHALSIHAFTPGEWEKSKSQNLDSPKCHGHSDRSSGSSK